MNYSKEQYVNIRDAFIKTKTLNDDFLNLMYHYYISFGLDPPLKDFEEFKYYLQEFVNTPVTVGATVMEKVKNARQQTITKGINNTISYFNKLFNI